jgi:hypothetical protein
MPAQSLLRMVKSWVPYQLRSEVNLTPYKTRGLYVLYKKKGTKDFNVVYIGVAGLGKSGGGGMRGRLESHKRKCKNWTHFSLFEVHDNIMREEIRELESLLLGIFRYDSRIHLANAQKGSKKMYQLLNDRDLPLASAFRKGPTRIK